MRVTIQFGKKSTIRFLDDRGKLDPFGSDVLPGERVFFFKDVLRASATRLFLVCLDGAVAVVDLDALSGIKVQPNPFG